MNKIRRKGWLSTFRLILLQTLPSHLYLVVDLFLCHSLFCHKVAFALCQTFYFRTSKKFITFNIVYLCLPISSRKRGIFKFTYVASNIFFIRFIRRHTGDIQKLFVYGYYMIPIAIFCVLCAVCCHPIGVCNAYVHTFCKFFL